jgi:hypothetical protein
MNNLFGNLIAIKMMYNAGKNNLKLKLNANKAMLNAGNI